MKLTVRFECAVSSVVEHYLDTAPRAKRNAPVIDGVSRVFPPSANISSNKVPNTPRFLRVERGIQRHLRTGELWFVGRRGAKVVWHRLGTPHLRIARATVAMIEANINGNHEISLVVDGKHQPLQSPATPSPPDKPLPRIHQLTTPVEPEMAPAKTAPAARSTPSGPVPTLEELLVRCRRGKDGLKRGTLKKLDAHLTMMRRYVDTHRPVTAYRAQDIRDFLAKARADEKKGQRRLKGQTINFSVWRPLNEAFDLAQEEDFIARNPMDSVKREKAEPIIRTQLKWSEAERVLADVKERGNKESYLELTFMLLMGVGQAEAKDFAGGAVDWQENRISFIRQKTKKPFHVPIYPWATDFIRTEITPRLKQGKPVFDWRNPRKALETACKNLGVASVDIRSLRRTLIIHLIEQKMDTRLIAKWQGHRDARLILSRYGNYIDADYEKEALAKLDKSPGQK